MFENIERDYVTINSVRKFKKALSHIKESDYLAYDTEATGVNTRKDTVIGYSFSGEVGKGFYMPLWYYDVLKEELLPYPLESVDHFELLHELCKKDLLMFNASYDVRITNSNFGIDMSKALYADIMLMKHTIYEEGDFKLKLLMKEYQEYIGIDAEKEANQEQLDLVASIKRNGGSITQKNYELYKADLEIIAKYACADADFTLRVGEYLADRLAEEGLEDFFYDKEVMPLYKEVTIKMEDKGVCLDIPLLQKTRESITKDMDNLEKEIINDLFSLEESQDWLDSTLEKKYPKSPKGNFGQKVCQYFGLTKLDKTKAGKFSLTKKSIEKENACEATEFLLGNADLNEDDVFQIQKEMHLEKNEKIINISSKPQMSDLVFNFMKIKPLSKTDGGKPQFDDSMIQELESQGFEWARKLGNYNKLIKIKGTYIDRFLDAQEGGIFYPSFFQHRTISGRYGSDLQQLSRPKEEGELDPIVIKYNNLIRKFFISGEDRVFIDNDYESLEPHVFAHVSGDEGLRDIFRKGHDFYSTIAIATEGLEGVTADKASESYLGKLHKAVRQAAKAYALGVPYGMTAYALGKTLEISTEEAQVKIDNYLGGFPSLKQWMLDSEYQVKTFGYVTSEAGRKRHLPRVKELYIRYGDKLLDFKFRASLTKKLSRKLGYHEAKDKVKKMYLDYKNGLNNAKNFQIQSLAASIVNMAAIEINRELDRRNIDGWVALQIHDQLVVNVPKDKAKECQELVQEIMESNYKLSLDLKAPAEISLNLADGH